MPAADRDRAAKATGTTPAWARMIGTSGNASAMASKRSGSDHGVPVMLCASTGRRRLGRELEDPAVALAVRRAGVRVGVDLQPHDAGQLELPLEPLLACRDGAGWPPIAWMRPAVRSRRPRAPARCRPRGPGPTASSDDTAMSATPQRSSAATVEAAAPPWGSQNACHPRHGRAHRRRRRPRAARRGAARRASPSRRASPGGVGCQAEQPLGVAAADRSRSAAVSAPSSGTPGRRPARTPAFRCRTAAVRHRSGARAPRRHRGWPSTRGRSASPAWRSSSGSSRRSSRYPTRPTTTAGPARERRARRPPASWSGQIDAAPGVCAAASVRRAARPRAAEAHACSRGNRRTARTPSAAEPLPSVAGSPCSPVSSGPSTKQGSSRSSPSISTSSRALPAAGSYQRATVLCTARARCRDGRGAAGSDGTSSASQSPCGHGPTAALTSRARCRLAHDQATRPAGEGEPRSPSSPARSSGAEERQVPTPLGHVVARRRAGGSAGTTRRQP